MAMQGDRPTEQQSEEEQFGPQMVNKLEVNFTPQCS